jgi:hypothetical protein
MGIKSDTNARIFSLEKGEIMSIFWFVKNLVCAKDALAPGSQEASAAGSQSAALVVLGEGMLW